MSSLFLTVFLIQTFALAFFDLISGVANDAVNFLAPAFGCNKKLEKKTTNKIFFWIFAVTFGGIMVGVMSSNGMMEVARKGVFHPGVVTFLEILILFGCVSMVNPFILRTFNNWRLPTSTTVSLVFGLYGAALAILVFNNGDAADYINSHKVLSMIMWILLAVVIAFIASAIIQYICRVILTFNYQEKSKFLLVAFASILNTCITYLVLFKGLKNSTLLDSFWQIEHIYLYLPIFALLFWIILFSILSFFINILTIVVLSGTFSIALAFAGNDLVNFIGVAMALAESIKIYLASGLPDPNNFYMTGLSGKVEVIHSLLLASGVFMCLTLWFSQKSRGVLERSLELAHSGKNSYSEDSSYISRLMVKRFITIHQATTKHFSQSFGLFLKQRFNDDNQDKEVAFDMVRASVMLAVSSIIISIATIQKLPLSTTYVTFMVAMGAAFADKAWGRESAVHRVHGVLNVIIGWFLTAFGAASICFITTLFFLYVGIEALSATMTIYILWNIYCLFSAKKEKEVIKESKYSLAFDEIYQNSLSFFKSSFTDFTTLLPVKENGQEADLKQLKDLLNNIQNKQSDLQNYLDVNKEKIDDKKARSLKYLLKSCNALEEMVDSIYKYCADMKLFILAQNKELTSLGKQFAKFIDQHIKKTAKNKLANDIKEEIYKYEAASLRRYRSGEEKHTGEHQFYERILSKIEYLVSNIEKLEKKLR